MNLLKSVMRVNVKILHILTDDIFAVNKLFDLFTYVIFYIFMTYIYYICHKCIIFDKINI